MAELNSLNFYKSLFENLKVAIFIADVDSGEIVDVNNEACLLMDNDYDTLVGMKQSQLHPPLQEESVKSIFKEHVNALLHGIQVEPIEHLIIDSNDNIIPVEITPNLIEYKNKKYISAMFKDLRGLRRKENILSYYDKALEKSSIFIALVDTNYTYMTVNESYAKTFNKSKEEIVGSKIYDLFGEEYFNNIIKSKFDKALTGESVEYEANFVLNNKKIFLQVHYEPYYSIDSKIIGVVVNIYDLTKYKEYEEENIKKEKLLIQQSKMAAMGEMLENIAHQWRQPLSIISTCTSGIMLQKDFNTLTDEMLKDSLNNIMNTTSYLSNTIDDFKNFFERDKQKFYFDIKDSINKTLELLEMSFGNNDIELIKNYNNDEIFIENYRNELMQVLLNIFNNAKDAILSNEKLDNKRKLIHIEVYKDEKYIYINIQDNAGGIPEDIMEKIFEPYFTTKHQSQGTGIGLFMTREIITKHIEGDITVINNEYSFEDEVYKGALFKIKILLI